MPDVGIVPRVFDRCDVLGVAAQSARLSREPHDRGGVGRNSCGACQPFTAAHVTSAPFTRADPSAARLAVDRCDAASLLVRDASWGEADRRRDPTRIPPRTGIGAREARAPAGHGKAPMRAEEPDLPVTDDPVGYAAAGYVLLTFCMQSMG